MCFCQALRSDWAQRFISFDRARPLHHPLSGIGCPRLYKKKYFSGLLYLLQGRWALIKAPCARVPKRVPAGAEDADDTLHPTPWGGCWCWWCCCYWWRRRLRRRMTRLAQFVTTQSSMSLKSLQQLIRHVCVDSRWMNIFVSSNLHLNQNSFLEIESIRTKQTS